MKKYFVILISILTVESYAQQLPQFTQYLINDYVINPAIGGSRPYYEAKLNHREQWIGITDAPRTNILSAYGPIINNKMGVGGYLFTDITGPTRRIGAQVSYAYHLRLTETIKLSFGVAGGLLQYTVDGAKITQKETGDPAMSAGVQSVLVPDAGVGTYIYSDKLFFGISVPQILNNRVQFFDNYEDSQSRLVGHYYVIGGYRFDINNDFTVEPSFFLKYVSPITPQLDVNARVIYQQMVWLALGYRTEDAASITAGYVFQKNLSVAYSYDITTSNLKNYSSGTHEIMIGVRFKNRKTAETSPSVDSMEE